MVAFTSVGDVKYLVMVIAYDADLMTQSHRYLKLPTCSN